MEVLAAHKRLALHLSFKLMWDYYKICGFLWSRMSLVIVIPNSLLLFNSRDKDA